MDIKTTKFLRGIALLMVLGSHYSLWMFNECIHPAFREFAMTWGVYGVDIFFLVSGYGLVKSASKKGIGKDYVLNRFIGVYLPYLLMVITCYVMDNGIPRGNDMHRLFTGYDYWYLYVQFAFYIIFAICYLVPRYRVISVTAAVAAFTYCLWTEGRQDFWQLSNAAFLVGIYLAEAEGRWEGIWKKTISRILLPIMGIAGTVTFIFVFRARSTMVWEMILSLFFTIAVAGIAINIKGFGVVLCSLGTYSLYIYVLHTRLFWKLVMYNESWTYFQRTLFAFVLTAIICIPLGFIIDNAMKWIKNRVDRVEAEK